MKLFLILCIGVLMLPTIPSAAGQIPTIEDVPTFTWSGNDGILVMGSANVTVEGLGWIYTRIYVDGRAQEGNVSFPGHTIRLTRGQAYQLVLRNELQYMAPSSKSNTMKDANITNLHMHGLHVSGEGNSDNVMRSVNGGECANYTYSIPREHMGGTFWYHPHHHGATHLQVSGGAVGALIVEDDPVADGIPDTVTAMSERIVLVQRVDPEAAGASSDTMMRSSMQHAFYLLNGVYNGVLRVPKSTWVRLRMVYANAEAKIVPFKFPGECEVLLMARDGYWARSVPKTLTSPLYLTGASRADLAIRCTGTSTIVVDGNVVGSLDVDDSAAPDSYPSPYDTAGEAWTPNFPSYLRDLTLEKDVVNGGKISMGASSINGDHFDPKRPIYNITSGDVVEWSVHSSHNHPLHLHMFPMQVRDSGCGNGYEKGEFYDTYAAGTCFVRFAAETFGGMAVLHCHILEHEDNGSMVWMGVNGGEIASGDGSSYQCLVS